MLLRVFSAELAHKTLYAKETGKEPEQTHDSSLLFGALCQDIRESLYHRFQNIWKQEKGYEGRKNSLEAAFEDHKLNFEYWRHIHEKSGESHIDLLILDPAVEDLLAKLHLDPSSGQVSPRANRQTKWLGNPTGRGCLQLPCSCTNHRKYRTVPSA